MSCLHYPTWFNCALIQAINQVYELQRLTQGSHDKRKKKSWIQRSKAWSACLRREEKVDRETFTREAWVLGWLQQWNAGIPVVFLASYLRALGLCWLTDWLTDCFWTWTSPSAPLVAEKKHSCITGTVYYYFPSNSHVRLPSDTEHSYFTTVIE